MVMLAEVIEVPRRARPETSWMQPWLVRPPDEATVEGPEAAAEEDAAGAAAAAAVTEGFW
jgi:hypothetical protein